MPFVIKTYLFIVANRKYPIFSLNNSSQYNFGTTSENEQGLAHFLSCEAQKPEQTKKDLLVIVDSEPACFFMTYKYFLIVVSNLRQAIYRRPVWTNERKKKKLKKKQHWRKMTVDQI